MRLQLAQLDSPLGGLTLVTAAGRLCALAFDDRRESLERWLSRRFGEVIFERSSENAVSRAVAAYFEGRLEAVDGIETDAGGTPFQQKVWSALRAIPAGRTCSYGDLARSIGEPGSIRAVGRANGANPVAIVVPCHRVIGADGSLTGYGGGFERKRWLLRHEAHHRGFELTSPPLC